jgi:hypothetical protein
VRERVRLDLDRHRTLGELIGQPPERPILPPRI